MLSQFYQNTYLKDKFQLQTRLYLNETKIMQHTTGLNTTSIHSLKTDHPGVLNRFINDPAFKTSDYDSGTLRTVSP